MESLFLARHKENKAWQGTLVEAGGRTGLKTYTGDIIEIDAILPLGETGKLIWIQEDVENTKR